MTNYRTKPSTSAKPFPSPEAQAATYEATVLGLTKPQRIYLAEIRAALPQPKRYTGKAAAPLGRLQALGLITLTSDADLDHAKNRLRWHLTAKAVSPTPTVPLSPSSLPQEPFEAEKGTQAPPSPPKPSEDLTGASGTTAQEGPA